MCNVVPYLALNERNSRQWGTFGMTTAATIDVSTTSHDWLILSTRFPKISPPELMTWFTDAARLNSWWGEEALIEPRPGGIYQVHWPSMGWTMRGEVAMVTADALVYSWTWDHEPVAPARTVVIRAEAEGQDAVLTITHGPYRFIDDPNSPELAERQGHHDGWLFFLPRLHEKISG